MKTDNEWEQRVLDAQTGYHRPPDSDLRREAERRMEMDRQAGYGNQAKPEPLVSLFPVDRQVMTDKAADHVISMTFTSASGGVPHIVTKQGEFIRCTCDAMKSIEIRPQGCWACVEFRRLVGIQAP